MDYKFFEILIPIIIQGGYDYLGWCVWLKEVTGNKYEVFYRITKFVLDFAVTIPVLLFLHWSLDLIAAFYLLKAAGWCDAVYIAIWKIFHPDRNYTAEGIWWMFFTPLGLKRSKFIYDPLIERGEENLYIKLIGKHYLKKGTMSLKEFQIQLIIGLLITFVIFKLGIISKLISLYL